MAKIMKFRKKRVIIEAAQFTGGTENAIALIGWVNANGYTAYSTEAVESWTNEDHKVRHDGWPEILHIETLEGTMQAEVDDWIIRGANGEFRPCKPDIFEAKYELCTSRGEFSAPYNSH